MSTMTRKQFLPGQKNGSKAPHPTLDAPPSRGAVAALPAPVTRERIQARAFEIYQARATSGQPGDANSDWQQAEHELNGSVADPTTDNEVEFKARARGERLMAGDDE